MMLPSVWSVQVAFLSGKYTVGPVAVVAVAMAEAVRERMTAKVDVFMAGEISETRGKQIDSGREVCR